MTVRILFLSDNYPPETNAPATRLFEHAVHWVREGHQVTVVTSAPNFPEGRIYEGYRNAWRQVETIEGIRVVRVKTFITANEGVVLRTLDYMSFMVMAFVVGLFERRPDVVVGTSPQFFTAVAAWALSVAKWRPFVFELRDLWPASIVAVGAMRKGMLIRVLEWVEMFLYRRACAVISVTEAFKRDLVERGIAAEKIHVVLNGADLSNYRPMARDTAMVREFDLDGKFVVGYLGTHGMAHALPKVLEAAERLQDRDDIVFLFAGAGAERATVERIVRERDLTNVRLVPRQPKARMPALWSVCDVALVPLRADPVFRTVIPSKIFEALAMGVPILATAPEGEATHIICENDVGVCVPPEDPEALAAAVVTLSTDGEARTRFRARAHSTAPEFSRENGARKMIEVLQWAQ